MPAPVVPAGLLSRDYGDGVTRRLSLINSAIAFALALLVMINLHEFAHGAAAVGFGFRPIIHASTETDPATAEATRITILLVGPVWSLISGLVVLALPQAPARHTFWRLAVLWFGLVSVQEFSGYLVLGAFTDVGDIGTVYQLLGSPLWMRIVVLLIGVALMYMTARVAIARFLQLTDPAQEMTPQLRRLGLFGWLLGVAIAVVLSIPTLDASADGLLEVFGTIAAGSFLVFVRLVMRRLHVRHVTPTFGWPVIGIAALVVIALVRILIFGPGITL
ncbi:MAG: hypothetical protein M3Y73_13410 [Actinomycetota bacterium]|nr:hypothetical protein [Actinomycetota bacterium]